MNVLIVVPWDQERGGVATVVNKLATHLSESGHTISFLHPGESERPITNTTQAGFPGFQFNLRNPFVREHPLRSIAAFWLLLPRTLYRLLKLQREQKIDIVSIHYPLPAYIHFALCRLVLRNRLVISVHGADLMPSGEQARRYPWSLRLLLRISDHLTTPSQHYLDSILARFPHLRAKSTPVHNGIDIAEFQGEMAAIEVAELDDDGALESVFPSDSLLCIAAHNSKKGIDTLLRALALVRSRGSDLSLVLVGDGPLRSELEELAGRLGIADVVRFAGFQGLSEVRHQLRQCGLFVLPSRAEPFGIVILEAMIHGKPVVSTRVGGIPEIITHLENGYLVPPDDPEALAGAISELSGNAALRRELGAAGVATVHERFTHRHTGSNFERLFSDLIRQDEVVTIRDKVHR